MFTEYSRLRVTVCDLGLLYIQGGRGLELTNWICFGLPRRTIKFSEAAISLVFKAATISLQSVAWKA